MALQSETIIAWLAGLGWNTADPGTDAAGVPLFPGPYVQKMPHRIVTITATSGIGFVLEGAADHSTFQARARGRPSPKDRDSYADAQALAFALDTLIFGASFPVSVNGQILVKVFRSGGQPAPLGQNPDDADRYEFICNYFAVTGV